MCPKALKSPRSRDRRSGSEMPIVHPNAAGIDVGSDRHFVAVPVDRAEQSIRSFRAFTGELHSLATWLKSCAITTVVMESTGVYWIPLYEVLESAGFEVKLANAHHAKNVPGRKSDVQDCRWLQRLHSFGLLEGSFRPDEQIRTLRTYTRQRETLVQQSSMHVQRMQKTLVQMNVQLHKVVSDISGVTGRRIITAILDGERSPMQLASLRHHGTKNSTETIAHALDGYYRDDLLFVLKQEFSAYEYVRQQIKDCDAQISATVAKLQSSQRPNTESVVSGQNDATDLRTELQRICGVDLTTIDGLNVLTVQTLISEVGLDMSRWPTVKHFCSWLGLSPNNKVTGGKVFATKTRKVKSRAAQMFRLAAQALARSQTALGFYYRRMRARQGPSKANTATAHKIARIFYTMLRSGTAYSAPGIQQYSADQRAKALKRLTKAANQLGYDLTPALSTAPPLATVS